MLKNNKPIPRSSVQMRLKSISNIAKITKSMKMIASTKVTKAQRAMETARVYGESGNSLVVSERSGDYGELMEAFELMSRLCVWFWFLCNLLDWFRNLYRRWNRFDVLFLLWVQFHSFCAGD
jgi:hypothetical protein